MRDGGDHRAIGAQMTAVSIADFRRELPWNLPLFDAPLIFT
jgi:hypothetical protein